MYQQFAVQSSTPWQRIRTLACIVLGLSMVVTMCAIISLTLVSNINNSDNIWVNDSINCIKSYNGVGPQVCKTDDECWLCASKTPQKLNDSVIYWAIAGMLMGISICSYMMVYVCNCDCVKFPEQQLQFIPPQPQQFNSPPQPQQIIQMQPISGQMA